jgi:hypothetical protein
MFDFRKPGVDYLRQTARGEAYTRFIDMMWSYHTSANVHPAVGIGWWEYMDKWGEKANWGLVSPRHNAYDGKEARRALGTDPWGYPTGGEAHDFGDFLSYATAAHTWIVEQLVKTSTLSRTPARK